MVQKLAARRGRPRAYDPDTALAQAMAVFWDAGFAGTSLDDITAGTGMNRPSLYGAFGDKQALYRQTLERYRAMAREALQETLRPDRPLRDAVRAVYERALSLYYSGAHGARGCFMIGTALTQAVLDADVREDLAAGLHEIDDAFEARMRVAQQQGELPASADPVALAKLASAVLHTLAIRSRAGEPRAALEAIVAPALDLICGPNPRTRPTPTGRKLTRSNSGKPNPAGRAKR
jgi:TetR/AcrR family transcriptional regulator, copper-responsive repressor